MLSHHDAHLLHSDQEAHLVIWCVCVQEVKTEQTRVIRGAKENRRSSANVPEPGGKSGNSPQKAPGGVRAMRAFWENAGQGPEKPQTGEVSI